MYKRDVPLIREYVYNKGPDGVLDVVTFVLCTIRVPLSKVYEYVEDVRVNQENSKHLWGHKSKGYLYTKEKKEKLYSVLYSGRSTESVLEEYLRVPGLGLPKASFVLQCVGYDTACLDGHNLKRLGLSANLTKGKTEAYLRTVREKGSEWYWDSWCEYIAGNSYNKRLPTADLVSAEHIRCIKLDHDLER